MASFYTARQNYELIDTSEDHIKRSPLQPHLVYDFIRKGSTNPDRPYDDDWEAVLLLEDNTSSKIHRYCLCGQDILNNYLLRNKDTRKAFVVGCVCVKKIEDMKIPTTSKICVDCGETTGRKKSSWCSVCKTGRTTRIYIKKYDKVLTYKELYDNYSSYCEWVVQTDFESPYFKRFKNWLLNFYEVLIE